MAKQKPTLSIVIVSYNTKELITNCLKSLDKVTNEVSFEVIVSDNGSTDGTQSEIQTKSPKVILVENKLNIGFAKGNNVARSIAKGQYILFLNPDTLMHKNTLKSCVQYLENNKNVGALTCKVLLPDGKLDPDTRRRFPTPWIALTHFSYLDRIFKGSIFDRYWYSDKSFEVTHEVEALQGAFFLTRRNVLENVNWFDEDYFLDGEDLDLSFKIHEAGFKVVYFSEVSITHIKKGSKKKNKSIKSVTGGVDAMKLFYKKRLWRRYPFILNILVIAGINSLKYMRVVKYHITNSL